MAAQVPVVVGLTICRDVVRETSGIYTVVRCFTGMPVGSFPGSGEPFCALAVLTDGEGDVPFRFVISRGAGFEQVRALGGWFASPTGCNPSNWSSAFRHSFSRRPTPTRSPYTSTKNWSPTGACESIAEDNCHDD